MIDPETFEPPQSLCEQSIRLLVNIYRQFSSIQVNHYIYDALHIIPQYIQKDHFFHATATAFTTTAKSTFQHLTSISVTKGRARSHRARSTKQFGEGNEYKRIVPNLGAVFMCAI